MIYAVWYPSGGFGHFINAMISLHGENFCRPDNNFSLGPNGNSHAVKMVLPKFSNKHKQQYSLPEIDLNMNYGVLIDNGINDESCNFLQYFPDAVPIKICYDDWSWPVVAQTHVTKAMLADLDAAISIDTIGWDRPTTWAKREKFFLYLRDHALRHQWRNDSRFHHVMINALCEYKTMRESLQNTGIKIEDFQSDWDQWWKANLIYYAPVIQARTVIAAVRDGANLHLSDIKDTWTQAVIYYFIWLHFDREVPHNDFADFFTDTHQIQQWLKL